MSPPRATPLSPEERRASIIRATTPVLLAKGPDLTTRDIAQAAGVAEGTIFKVFESKEAVVQAVVDHLLDPADTCAELAVLEPADLTEAVREVVTLLQRRIRDFTTVAMALRMRPPDPDDFDEHAEHHRVHVERSERLLAAVVAVLTPWQHQLRLPVDTVASTLRAMAFATSHPMLSDGALTDPADIAAVLLHGLLQPPVGAADAVHPTATHPVPEEAPC